MTQQLPFLAGRLSEHAVVWKIIPYGLAHRTANGLVCQHGFAECTADRLAACGVHLAGDSLQAVPFLYCLEVEINHFSPEIAARVCANRMAPFTWHDLVSCHRGSLGDKLVAQAGEETRAAQVSSVPLVVANGLSLDAPWLLLDIIGSIRRKVPSQNPSTKHKTAGGCTEDHPC